MFLLKYAVVDVTRGIVDLGLESVMLFGNCWQISRKFTMFFDQLELLSDHADEPQMEMLFLLEISGRFQY